MAFISEPSTSKDLPKLFVHLDKSGKKPKKGRPKADLLNVIRRSGVGRAAFKDLKYEDLTDLYKLWCEYFQGVVDLIGGKPDPRILKADFHGCILRVTAAQNPTQIGLYGIVCHESKHTFQMITPKNTLIIIPKEGSTFQFVLNGKVFTLFGDALKQKSYLRGRKARHRSTLPFFLK